jgi:hypothetical protein
MIVGPLVVIQLSKREGDKMKDVDIALKRSLSLV